MSEQIIIYVFFDKRGREQSFTTMDEATALTYALDNGYSVMGRTYEYKSSRVIKKRGPIGEQAAKANA